MRQRRLLIILLLALGSGGLAAYLALNYLRDQTPQIIASEPRHTKVAVAAVDLTIGQILKPEHIRMVDWPAEAVPPGYAAAPEVVVGRGVITPIRANEALLDGKLAMKEAGGGLAIAVPEGMRAVSVRVDEVIAVAGFVLPNTRVDVVVTLPPTQGRSEASSQIFLQNMQVVAAGQMVQQDAEGKPVTVTVMTLLVTPEEGEMLILASTEGRIQLALRNTLDLEEVTTPGARVTTLLRGSSNGTAPARPRRAAAPSGGDAATVIEAYKGGVRTLIRF